MTDTLAYLRGRRIWLVPDFSVWGALSAGEFSFLLTEDDPGSDRLLFMSTPLGGNLQSVKFTELIDIRGNSLPSSIVNPKVIPLPKDAIGAVVTSRESTESFTIAKTPEEKSTCVCDLLVIEVG